MLKDFRKRLNLEKILQGSIYSLSGGLLAAGVMIAIFQGLNFLDWYYYLISGGVGLAVFGIIFLVYYLINKVSEKDVARRIDQSFNLREKAATMVEFKDKDSLLIQKQREDAKRSIKVNNPRKLILKLTMASLPLPLLGAGVFTTSFFTHDIVNMLTVETEEENFDDDTDKIIDDIKDYIGKSQASAAFKERLYQILEDLRADLKGDISIPSRFAKVQVAKNEVDVALNEVNTKEEIGEELKKEENDFTPLSDVILEADTESLEEAFKDVIEKVENIYTTGGLLDAFDELIKALENLLKNLDIPSTDANYKTFSDLLAKLQAIYDNVEEKIAATSTPSLINQLISESKEQAKKAIDEAISNLKKDLTLEKANDQLAADVKKLMDQLIDPSTTEDPNIDGGGSNNNQDGEEGEAGDKGDQETDQNEGEEGDASGGEGNGDGDKGEGNGTGTGGQEGEGEGQGQGEGAGGGDGSTNYGSNDKVYTGENGSTEYGEVIGDYQNEASDDAKNTGDDDLEGAIGDYFDELYGEGGNDQTNP